MCSFGVFFTANPASKPTWSFVPRCVSDTFHLTCEASREVVVDRMVALEVAAVGADTMAGKPKNMILFYRLKFINSPV